jgi:hypothetical protein
MPSLYDLSTLPIRSDMNMFAHHTIEDARINVTPAKFFVTNNIKGKYGIAIKK